jgi:DNA-binding response OmpR family regulator
MAERARKRALVVEDDPGVRSLLQHALEQMGFEVTCARAKEEALKFWEEKEYSLLITDLVLGPSGGDELIRAIRRKDARVPILAVTGFGQEVAQEALDAGADYILRKPFHLLELRKIIEGFSS